jgi:hypothetical protein
MASVYLGVYASGIAYDLMTGAGLNIAQDPGRAQTWALYSLSNYGVAIVAVLLLRVVSPYLGLGLHQTHLTTYCWTFAIAFVNCFGFALITLFLMLPPLLAIKAPAGEVWDVDKLRFVSSGTVFFIAFGLAIAAQFALRKGTEGTPPVLTPRTS